MEDMKNMVKELFPEIVPNSDGFKIKFFILKVTQDFNVI